MLYGGNNNDYNQGGRSGSRSVVVFVSQNHCCSALHDQKQERIVIMPRQEAVPEIMLRFRQVLERFNILKIGYIFSFYPSSSFFIISCPLCAQPNSFCGLGHVADNYRYAWKWPRDPALLLLINNDIHTLQVAVSSIQARNCPIHLLWVIFALSANQETTLNFKPSLSSLTLSIS